MNSKEVAETARFLTQAEICNNIKENDVTIDELRAQIKEVRSLQNGYKRALGKRALLDAMAVIHNVEISNNKGDGDLNSVIESDVLADDEEDVADIVERDENVA